MTTDPTTLRAEITRLRRALTVLRNRYANLLAATRAAVAAHEDGEPDPIAYLRDELPDHPTRPDRLHPNDSAHPADPAGSDK